MPKKPTETRQGMPDIPGVIKTDAVLIAGPKATRKLQPVEVVQEDALTLRIEDVGDYTLMWTPTVTDRGLAQGFTLEDGLLGDEEHPEGLCLALGFALSEGLITQLTDLKSISACPEQPATVQLQLQHPERVEAARKNVLVNSSCGICGPREILEENRLNLQPVEDNLRISPDDFPQLIAGMQQQQSIFARTGGSHAAAIFDQSGRIIAAAEDLGRHNALDKVIGSVLIQRGNLRRCGVLLSSRLSLEMVLKAVRCGLQLMLAVSAPTSLAIDVAQRFGVTLCGFVRDSRATIYSHPQRLPEVLDDFG